MKKRFLSLVLALCMGASLVVPAAAADGTSTKVKEDMEAMRSANLFVDGMTVSEKHEDGTSTYAYHLTEEVTDYITPSYGEDGSMTIDIVEGDCHDVILIKADGTSFLNGVKLERPEPSDVDGMLNTEIMPLVAFDYAYSNKPFPGTTAAEYNVGPMAHNNPNVYLGKAIRYLAGYAIGYAIATYLFPVSPNFAGEKCAEIGLALKTKAEEMADNTNTVSYKVTSYGRMGNDTFKFYKKFVGTYYTRTNYKGASIYKNLYELRTTLN